MNELLSVVKKNSFCTCRNRVLPLVNEELQNALNRVRPYKLVSLLVSGMMMSHLLLIREISSPQLLKIPTKCSRFSSPQKIQKRFLHCQTPRILTILSLGLACVLLVEIHIISFH